MRGKRLATVSALAAGTLAATGLAFAPAAAAVTPQSATINATCTIGGGGAATLTATQDGTAATITLSSTAVTAPIPIAADSVTSTLSLVNANGGTTAFSGKKNPAMAAGSGVSVGPRRHRGLR